MKLKSRSNRVRRQGACCDTGGPPALFAPLIVEAPLSGKVLSEALLKADVDGIVVPVVRVRPFGDQVVAPEFVEGLNAEAGSGGDVYPYQFKLRRIGMTVGTRTWGGVMGDGRGPRLMDGGYATAPDLGTYSPDGKYILENSGMEPDYEVYIYPADDFHGRDPQLEKGIEIIMEELRRHPAKGIPEFEKVNRRLYIEAKLFL